MLEEGTTRNPVHVCQQGSLFHSRIRLFITVLTKPS
jgi:hypothetical protein